MFGTRKMDHLKSEIIKTLKLKNYFMNVNTSDTGISIC